MTVFIFLFLSSCTLLEFLPQGVCDLPTLCAFKPGLLKLILISFDPGSLTDHVQFLALTLLKLFVIILTISFFVALSN